MTHELGEKGKPILVLIHGFGGSGMIFFRLFKRLKEDYHVFAIDLLGMGCSSRPKFLARTKEEAEWFYIQSLEKWRKKLKLGPMNLVAHSFGGYISSRYALKFPENVRKLILWSPHGMEPKPDEYEEFLNKLKNQSCRFGCFIKMMQCIFKYELRPLNCLRCCARC